MIEEKTQSSVWNIAMLAVILFLAVISFEGIFAGTKTVPISVSVVK